MARICSSRSFLQLLLIQALLQLAYPQPYIGINYGEVADNLPPPSTVVTNLLQTTTIQTVRLYGSNPSIITALANTGLNIVLGVPNSAIPSLATDASSASSWVSSNISPFHPASHITTITVGNEIYFSGDRTLMSQLTPAMRNLNTALSAAGLQSSIKVSTVNAMTALASSDPPSSGRFDPNVLDLVRDQLDFLNQTGSPFAINPYPYFAYQSDPRPETLAFCLFEANPGRVDSGTGVTYTNMFDSQVDAVRSAINAVGPGFEGVEIVVAETGWPSRGDANEVGPGVDNAKKYVGNLLARLRSGVGTPLMAGKAVETYLFALFDEDLKPGSGSERAFGIFKTDLSMVYDVGLLKSEEQGQGQVAVGASPSPKGSAGGAAGWCVPKGGVAETELQSNIDYACGLGIDCSGIQPGGPCFEPNTVASHAAYAMNLLYQTAGRNPWNCDFSQTAVVTDQDPSYDGCKFPGGSA